MKVPVLLFVAVLAVGCSGSMDGGDDPSSDNSTIVLRLRETHPLPDGVGSPQPTVLLETLEIYQCSNYEIVSCARTLAGVLHVNILGVELPGIVCFRARGSARAEIVVPELVGCTGIVVRYGNVVDQYALAVDEASFHISGQEGSFTQVGDTLVWRFPQRSMVYTCGTLTQDSCLCAHFRDSLLAQLNLQPIAVPEIGYWPYPRETMGHYYEMPPSVFQYSDESDFRTAGEILDAFTRTVLSGHLGAGLALRNWRNEKYASWLIPDSTVSGF